MKNKRKNQIKSLIAFTLVLSLVSIGAIGYMTLKTYLEMKSNDSGISEIYNNDFYSLRSNATTYQTDLYSSLSESLKSSDDELTAKLVAQNFIADLYTFSNKTALTDVGGLQYVDPSMKTWFYQLATDSLYNDVATFIADEIIEDSLTVVSSTATLKQANETLGEVNYQGYWVHVRWEYQTGGKVNISEYENESDIFVVKDTDGRFSIVKVSSSQDQNSQNTNEEAEDLGDE